MNNLLPPDSALAPWVGIVFIWSTLWKGVALWRAAKLGQRNWFIAILVISTVGVLELIYLFKFAKDKLTFAEIKSWLPARFSSTKDSKKS